MVLHCALILSLARVCDWDPFRNHFGGSNDRGRTQLSGSAPGGMCH
ncbi:hypothetical protein RISK_006093 [Rhodopirellula islandica]|uniref:Uncharacterized protein n=1 Tax=Rhodopirellula islandica TaxID=595434 RepID=A0A0J1E8W8_RHOIS|nr:hypothetical protein RISK_006093 [Rhodopirellula islandica]